LLLSGFRRVESRRFRIVERFAMKKGANAKHESETIRPREILSGSSSGEI